MTSCDGKVETNPTTERESPQRQPAPGEFEYHFHLQHADTVVETDPGTGPDPLPADAPMSRPTPQARWCPPPSQRQHSFAADLGFTLEVLALMRRTHELMAQQPDSRRLKGEGRGGRRGDFAGKPWKHGVERPAAG